MKSMPTIILLLLAAIALFLLYGNSAKAGETLPPLEALFVAKKTGILPAWADVTDRWRLVPQWPRRVFLCVENRQGPGRWTVVGDIQFLLHWYETGLIEMSARPSVPATAQEIAVCFP